MSCHTVQHRGAKGPLQVLPQQVPASLSRLVAGAPVATPPSLHCALLAYDPKQKHTNANAIASRLHSGARCELTANSCQARQHWWTTQVSEIRTVIRGLASYPPKVHVTAEAWRSGCSARVAGLHRVTLQGHPAILLERALLDVKASHRGVAEQSGGGFGMPRKNSLLRIWRATSQQSACMHCSGEPHIFRKTDEASSKLGLGVLSA